MYINSHENAQTIYKDYLLNISIEKKTVSSDLHHKEVNNKKKINHRYFLRDEIYNITCIYQYAKR